MRKLTICLGCLVLILLSVSMAVSYTLQITDDQCDTRLRGEAYIPGFGRNVFLHGFSLNNGENIRKYHYPDKDNHVKRIAVFPGTTSTRVCLSDKDPHHDRKDDLYSACVYATPVPDNYEIQKKRGRCKAQCTIYLDYKPNHTIIIRGFSFDKTGKDDMHIKQIAIRALEPGRSGKTRIAFMDKHKNKKFDYEIWYTNVPNSLIKDKVVINQIGARRNDAYADHFTDSSTVPGIASFSFTFRGTDHHLSYIRLTSGWEYIDRGGSGRRGNDLHMDFQDKNGDDPVNYFCEIYWFDLNPQPKKNLLPPGTRMPTQMPTQMPIQRKLAVPK